MSGRFKCKSDKQKVARTFEVQVGLEGADFAPGDDIRLQYMQSVIYTHLGSKRNQTAYGVGPQVIHVLQTIPLVYAGRSKFAAFSTCRRKTEGRISRAVQMSKIERKDGLVFPSSIRLMKARSYPAFAANASWLIFCCVRRFRKSSPKATEGSVLELGVLEAATPHCGTASICQDSASSPSQSKLSREASNDREDS